ncbi:hypothetical protein NL676_009630 [Syzygium grande]|nr:hypothetical protein NL676_009630 [Syzygium grande]
MHSNGKALLSGLHCFTGGVTSSVANRLERSAKASDSVSNECDVLVPAHQMAFPSCASNDDSFHTLCDLHIDQGIIGFEVQSAIELVWGFDACDQPERSDILDQSPGLAK